MTALLPDISEIYHRFGGNSDELHQLLSHLNLGQEINWDWFILLLAKTGMRFSEALAVTPTQAES